MLGLLLRRRLTDREFHWLYRRSRDKRGIGIPEDVKSRIIDLGYGEPEGLYSFRLTQKGQEYLARCMEVQATGGKPAFSSGMGG